ncbi:MAG: 30S ribosomal protein S20 [Candidatus Moeniiplasma glomeromycotorum]|nr:30S ribosomal protein S20 [Candidatus Moeniiplasma glomeromycotorum]MCE8162311.1 30S ribosomal protein S20 [Candidatus Moeniiplasma glomeromycotorum]MCE8163762.1 30S ribosomal protein S20 [Candidatus Moeniiplasma glomeromycotorum]MCE8166235.1 30S ribosomal protein S20 [Candidatus Moeniiplasma glomeromycotorum]MCE8166717.1 30S ribosomal protein S20 [Candidatus Moeniiplasma glomeromycotorum]
MSVSQQLKNKKRQSQNRKYKKLVKDQLKKINYYLAGKLKEKKISKEEIEKFIPETQKVLDRSVCKGIIHKNKSARQKSKLQKRFNEWRKSENIQS